MAAIGCGWDQYAFCTGAVDWGLGKDRFEMYRHKRIGPICGVVDRALGCLHDQLKTRVHGAARLIEDRRIDLRVQVRLTQLRDEPLRSMGEEVVQQVVSGLGPVFIPRVG